jgi:hypothetical protein
MDSVSLSHLGYCFRYYLSPIAAGSTRKMARRLISPGLKRMDDQVKCPYLHVTGSSTLTPVTP